MPNFSARDLQLSKILNIAKWIILDTMHYHDILQCYVRSVVVTSGGNASVNWSMAMTRAFCWR